MKRIAFLLSSFLLAALSHAASFDCAKAGTNVEHMICDEPAISELDDQMAYSYKAALQKNKSKAVSIKKEQLKWLKKRNECEDRDCLIHVYEPHISSLKAMIKADANPNQQKYSLVEGSGQPLCEQILRRMNDETSSTWPTCGIYLLKPIRGVTLPKWKELDLKKNKQLYMRFLLASMISEKDYKLVFGNQQTNGGSVESQDIPIPPPSTVPFGEHLTEDNLSRMWQEAVKTGHEFYRWDGALPAPDESDVLLIDSGKNPYRYSSCPQIRIIRFSKDLLTPKPFPKHVANWLLGSSAIPFKYDDQLYRMINDEYLARDPETGVESLPSRILTIDAIRHDEFCRIDTNQNLFQ